MIPVSSIAIHWSESKHIQNEKLYFTFSDVNRALSAAKLYAPDPGKGYDKTSFSITWEDGFIYSGRLDLNKNSPSLNQHVKDFIGYIRAEQPALAKRLPENFPKDYQIRQQSS